MPEQILTVYDGIRKICECLNDTSKAMQEILVTLKSIQEVLDKMPKEKKP